MQAAARLTQNRASGKGEERNNRVRIGGRWDGQPSQGKNIGQAENGNRDHWYEDRPQQQSLRRRDQAQDDIFDDEFVLNN